MYNWYREWGVWLVTVLALIAFGVLIGSDLTRLNGISSAISALGTLMLGVAALSAIPVWKHQEKIKFQASVAAELHAGLSEVRQQIDSALIQNQHSVRLARLISDKELLGQEGDVIEKSCNILRQVTADIQRGLEKLVIPKAMILSKDFFNDTTELAKWIRQTTPHSDKPMLSAKQLTEIKDRIDVYLKFLEDKALFRK